MTDTYIARRNKMMREAEILFLDTLQTVTAKYQENCAPAEELFDKITSKFKLEYEIGLTNAEIIRRKFMLDFYVQNGDTEKEKNSSLALKTLEDYAASLEGRLKNLTP